MEESADLLSVPTPICRLNLWVIVKSFSIGWLAFALILWKARFNIVELSLPL